MARWIGPTIVVFAALAACAVAQSPPNSYDRLMEPAAPVQRATYQSGDTRAPFNPAAGPVAPAFKQPEPMPIGPSNHEGTDRGAHAGRHEIPASPSAIPAMASVIGSLLVVLGLFLGLAWLMRRGLPKGSRLLSSDVVQILGRAPLAGRQQMQLVRFGNKLLLICVSPGGAETLSEIVDPAEIDRIAGICQQADAHSATNAFRQVFRQFGDEGSIAKAWARSGDAAKSKSARAADPMHAEDDDV